MWRNYLTAGFRAWSRQKVYAFINIFGLALGLAACLLLLLYVRYETSYDGWLPDADRAFQVQTTGIDDSTGGRIAMQAATQPVAAALAKDFPQLEAVSKLEGDDIVVMKDGRAERVEVHAADERFFDILPVPFLRGAGAGALKSVDSVALSRSQAMRRFGTVDAIGRTLTTVREGKTYDLRVTGVFEDLPKNSHLNFSIVRRFTSAEESPCPWGCVNGGAYVKLKPGIDVAAINAALPAWEKRNVPARDVAGGDLARQWDWRLVNVRDVHLSGAEGDRPGNDTRSLATFAIVAFLILAMACVNFVNLATARASRRAREVAVRKVLGARRVQLVAQFLGESMLLVAVAMVIAMALVELVLPVFSSFLDAELELAYFGPGGMALPIVALTALVGLAGGLYPAFYLSRAQPASILKGGKGAAETEGAGRLRTLLVVAQFAISIGLIACTAVVYQQTVFARTVDAGYQREGLLEIKGFDQPEIRPVREAIQRQIAAIGGVTGVAGTMIEPGSSRTLYTTVSAPGQPTPVKLGWYSVEPAFFDVLKIPMAAGRPLSPRFANDKAFIDEATIETEAKFAAAQQGIARRGVNVVVNATAARKLGFGEPERAIGRQIRIPMFQNDVMVPATIVGVARDSRFRSIREPVEPMIYHDSGYYRWAVVRYEGVGPERVRAEAERVWRRLAPTVPFESHFVESRLAALYGADEARGQTFAGFAALAILIACLGLFGLAAFTAERRTREIGIRKVFGARVRDIVRLLGWQFSKPVVLANLIAWPVAWWVMRDWLNGFDARIPLGPGPFLTAGLLALAIALGTIAGHAVRVARLNPIHALRYE
ncbi:MAG TPA: ABC transporter permease [Allosphingosinicella sp.]|jgi:putative ABC transport system permease protein|nr:ABC transporter permease [Allosphingosinicella sp.]